MSFSGEGVVQAAERGVVVTAFGGEAKALYVFHADFLRSGLGLQNFHDLGDVFIEGHGARIGSAIHQVGSDIRWNQFENLGLGTAKLITEGLRVGMNGGFGGAVGWRESERDERQSRRDGHNGGTWLLLQEWQKRRGQTDGAEEVDGNNRFGIGKVFMGS